MAKSTEDRNKKIALYNLHWPAVMDPLQIELYCIRRGGKWKKTNGEFAGAGLEHHYRTAMDILWPEAWHKWRTLLLESFINHRIIAVMGPASSGKSHDAAQYLLIKYYTYHDCCTILVGSTEIKMLDLRIFGELKKYHKMARRIKDWLPGNLIESKQMIVSDLKTAENEGRDFRNGIIGVPYKKGQTYQGLGSMVGVKNTHLELVVDEGSLIPRIFVDAISNLNKNAGFHCIVLGNPKDTTDALGVVAEPAAHLGGWDGAIDQTEGTKTWPNRFQDGLTVQLVGSDCPNMDVAEDQPVPFPFLITRQSIQSDIEFYGRDSLQFTMMNEARMPRGSANRRVITRNMCLKFGAMEEPIWENEQRTNIGFLDAAYGGAGGDRTVFGQLQFGPGFDGEVKRQLLLLVDTIVVPTSIKEGLVEDQIANFTRDQCEQRKIPPANFFFDTTGRGSLMSAFSRLWSSEIQGIEFGGSAPDVFVSSNIQISARDYYDRMVTFLWFRAREVIEARQFRGMSEEVMQEGCFREWGFIGKNRVSVEPKEQMKLKCFVAGTMIKTINGESSIENISVGDMLETPFGPSKVIESHCSQTSMLYSATFSNGSNLTGTGHHKVFTWNAGWTNLDTLSLDSIMESDRMLPLWNLGNLLFTRTMFITFKQWVDIISEAGRKRIRGRRDFYTESYGKTTVGLFLKVFTYIMLMVIGKITASIICNWLKLFHIVHTILKHGGRTLISEPWHSLVFQTGSLNLKSGTVLQKAEYGIERMRLKTRPNGDRSIVNASNAEKSFWLFGKILNFAAGIVMGSSEKKTTVKITAFAQCAARSIWAIFTNRHPIVPNRVQALQCGKPENVFNLTLAEHNCYYANGILVANSGRSPDLFDALVCGIWGAQQRGFVIKMDKSKFQSPNTNDQWKMDLQRKSKALKQTGQMDWARA